MKVICAWCEIVIKDCPGGILSHGICQSCQDKVIREALKTKEQKGNGK